jgi:hypothetical protein
LVPGKPTRIPGSLLPITGRNYNSNYAMYAPDYVTPYTDNLTLSITRTLRRNLTLDVRYIDTMGKALPGTAGAFGTTPGSVDINTVNVYHNPELFKALEATRAGQDDPLFDQMLMGLNLNVGVPGYGPVGTTVNINGVPVVQRGSAQLRRLSTVTTNLANGNYAAVISTLLGTNPTTGTGGAQPLPNNGIDPATGLPLIVSQRILRNGCDRIANGLTTGFTTPNGTAITPRCFPENYFIANPQLSGAIYASNYGHTNYQELETQVTLRPTHGMSVQATYSFSKTMEQPGSGYTDPLNRSLDYRKAATSPGQEFRANGTIELPVGPNKLLLPNSSGWLARALERWQSSFILYLPHGAPRNFVANNMLYANGRPDIVGPWNNPKGSVSWNGDFGSYFGDPSPYATFQDPQCTQRVGATDANGFNLQANCTLRGLAKIVPDGTAGAIPLANGKFGLPLLQNPLPGHQGTLGANTMYTLSRWTLDANVGKSFQLTESKVLQLRVDCTNVLNHPTPADPIGLANTNILNADNNFGQITTKTGNRTFQGKLRITF